MNEFAENLRSLRKQKKWTQEQLADIADIPVKTLQNYEQNRNGCEPNLHNLMILADIFDISPYALYYGGEKEMNTNSVYMDDLLSELSRLDFEAVAEIHDSMPNGVALPKLSLTEDRIDALRQKWNLNVRKPQRGIYRNYIEQTVSRYAQDRHNWKEKFL